LASLSVDQKLAKCGAVMYDVEIISAVPDENEPRVQGLHYCGGWDDYAGMGISVITAYDFYHSNMLVYLSDNLDDFRTLVNSRDCIIGYNSIRFDNNVMAANGINISKEKVYDLWVAITNTQPSGHRSGYKLSNMLSCNGIDAKTEMGSEAPLLAQTGKWGRLITYCLGDTYKQVQLLRLACSGVMKSPKDGQYMNIKLPWDSVEIDKEGLF